MKLFQSSKDEIKLKKKDIKELRGRINRRMRVTAVISIASIAGLGVFIACQMAENNKEYSQRALSQLDYTNTTIVAKSGEIYDSTMTPIAVSNRVYTLILDPKVIIEYENMNAYEGTLDATARAVAQCFELDFDDVRNAITENSTSSYLRYYVEGNVKKKTVVSEEQKDAFDALEDEINNGKVEEESTSDAVKASSSSKARVAGVWFETEYRRYYPYNELASKVIGFTTEDTTEGIWGLERYYNDELRGTNGRQYSYINENGELEQDVAEAKDGYSLVSTIDINLTQMISDALDDWLAETDENGELVNHAKAVNVLAMDPNTGAVKAMVTSTDYNLNDPKDLTSFYTDEEIAVFADNQDNYDAYQLSLTEEETETEAKQDDGNINVISPYTMYIDEDGNWDSDNYPTTTDVTNEIWRNAIISNSFEPGSTGKIITFAAALEEGKITPDTIFEDPQGYTIVGNTMIKCHNFSIGGCGTINANMAIAKSCNVSLIQMANLLGSELFTKYQKLHNFGQRTGIDLPGEASCAGLLFTAESMGEVDLATNSFGQCYNVTMLQMAAAYCADINGGYYYQPYTVEKLLDSNGNVVEEKEPVLVRQVISEDTSAKVREAMRLTVTEEGTGYGVQVADRQRGILMEGYDFGAKTGTAQKLPRSENKYILSVISAAPMSEPKMLLYVTLDEYSSAEFGEDNSAPAQYLSGMIWNAIKDYIGLYSDQDVDAESFDWTAIDDQLDGLGEGNSIMSNIDGNEEAIPIPPQAAAESTEAIEDPDSIINPEDAIAAPALE